MPKPKPITIPEALARFSDIIARARAEHAAERKEDRKCTSKSAPSKSPARAAA